MQRRNQRTRQDGDDDPRQHQRSPRRGYPLLIAFAIVVLALITTLLPVNTAAAAQEHAACDGDTLVRRLILVDQGDTDAATLDTAIAEAVAIWATANVRLVWMPVGAAIRPDAYVVLRGGHPNPAKEAALMRSGGLRELGWVRYEPDGRRANLVEVSLPAVRATLMNAWFGDRRFRVHARDLQAHLLGRALGRVIAHELGHWLIGLGHAEEGLMKPILRHDDLVGSKSPQLPPSWNVADDSRLAALRARCG